MAEEVKDEEVKEESKLSFKTADELSTFLMDLQGQIGNLQETVDKLSPVEEESTEETKEDTESDQELTDEEVSEIDQLLQSE